MRQALQRYNAHIAEYFRRIHRESPSEWCERNIKLPGGYAETEPGRIRFDQSPYLREPIDAMREPGVQEVLFAGPTRIGKTIILRLVFAYGIAGRPCPMILIDSTVTKGRGLSRKELIPLVNHNRILRDRKPTGKDRHNFSTAHMLFPGASFDIYGANSPNQVSGDSVKWVLGNEGGKWQGATKEEAAILDLARHRTESYDEERRHLISSTPTTEHHLFWVEVMRGDLRKWFVPCPVCGYVQQLEWGDEASRYGVKWDRGARRVDGTWDFKAVMESARYHCANPDVEHEPWTDEMRLASIVDRRSAWRPTQEGQPGYRTYHLNGLYGRRKNNRLGELAVAFLSVRTSGFLEDRHDFWNSRMGMVYLDTVVTLTAKKLGHLERDYHRGSVPKEFKTEVLIIGVDVQSWGMPWACYACRWNGETHLVDHGTVKTFEDVEGVQRDYRELCEESYVIIDIGYDERLQETKEAIFARLHLGWMAADGVEFSRDRVALQRSNVYEGGKDQAKKLYIPRLVISTYDFKWELEKLLGGEIKGFWIYQVFPLVDGEEALRDHADLKEQLLAESRRPRKSARKGLPRWEFFARHNKNHKLDCTVYARALLWFLAKRKSFKRRQKKERRLVPSER